MIVVVDGAVEVEIGEICTGAEDVAEGDSEGEEEEDDGEGGDNNSEDFGCEGDFVFAVEDEMEDFFLVLGGEDNTVVVVEGEADTAEAAFCFLILGVEEDEDEDAPGVVYVTVVPFRLIIIVLCSFPINIKSDPFPSLPPAPFFPPFPFFTGVLALPFPFRFLLTLAPSSPSLWLLLLLSTLVELPLLSSVT